MLCNCYCECVAQIGWGLFNAVCHGWANSGPRDKCDPTQRFQWPAEASRKIFKSESSFNSHSEYWCWGYKQSLASTLMRSHNPPLNAALSRWPLSSKIIAHPCSSTASRFQHQLHRSSIPAPQIGVHWRVHDSKMQPQAETYFAEYSQQSRSFYYSHWLFL